MAPAEVCDDYYEVFEISSDATPEMINAKYRKLALLRHPDKHRNSAEATAAFQLLGNAYETLKDPARRRQYDIRWPAIKAKRRADQDAARYQADIDAAELKKYAEHEARLILEQREIADRIKMLDNSRLYYERDIFQQRRECNNLSKALENLQQQDEAEAKNMKQNLTWWSYIISPVLSQPIETDKEKDERKLAAIRRQNNRYIKTQQLEGLKKKLEQSEEILQNTLRKLATEKENDRINRARTVSLQESKHRERVAKDEEARKKRQAEEQDKYMKEREAERKRTAEEAWRRRMEAERVAEEARKLREAADALKERQARAAAAASAATKRQNSKNAGSSQKTYKQPNAQQARSGQFTSSTASSEGSTHNNTSTCQHKKFWIQVNGRQWCCSCNIMQSSFGFQCPECNLIACASCRRALKGQKPYKSKSKK